MGSRLVALLLLVLSIQCGAKVVIETLNKYDGIWICWGPVTQFILRQSVAHVKHLHIVHMHMARVRDEEHL